MATYTLVEVERERFVILDEGGRLSGFIPWVAGDAPVVQGAHPSLGAFPLDEACAHIKRWLWCRLIPVGQSEREQLEAEEAGDGND